MLKEQVAKDFFNKAYAELTPNEQENVDHAVANMV
tara:strand:- start:85676 stop:85780 length:105 start_codon:yes stop_codon:yes gene_type:complete